MELFLRAKAVRLRSHNGKYLVAEEDDDRVFQDRNGSTRRARWEVEIVESDPTLIRLRSCYGKFLSASNEPFLLGFTGRKVLQVSAPSRLDSSLEWEPVRAGFQIKLKTRYGQFLRANGGPPPWRNSLTHDIPHIHHDWVLWEVDIMEVREYSPTPAPAPAPAEEAFSPSFAKQESFSSSTSSSSLKSESGRCIHYMVANNDGYVQDSAEEFTFSFKGHSVEELTHKLEEETDLGHIIVCSRNPVDGKLCPLRLHLPPNKTTLNVVIVQASSKVARAFAKLEKPL